jgi:hypothetical protein
MLHSAFWGRYHSCHRERAGGSLTRVPLPGPQAETLVEGETLKIRLPRRPQWKLGLGFLIVWLTMPTLSLVEAWQQASEAEVIEPVEIDPCGHPRRRNRRAIDEWPKLVLFECAGLIGVGAMLLQRRLTVRPGELTFRRGLFGLWWTERFAAADVRSFGVQGEHQIAFHYRGKFVELALTVDRPEVISIAERIRERAGIQ